MPSAAKAKRLAAKTAKADASVDQLHSNKNQLSPVPNVRLAFPPSLTSRQRAVLHQLGDDYGLDHDSHGDDPYRCIALGPTDGVLIDVQPPSDSLSAVDDDLLVAVLKEHLRVDASAAFQSKPTPKFDKNVASNGSTASTKQKTDLDQFVALMTELIELEHTTEVEAAHESLSSLSPEQAQNRGMALLNLRVADAEGGLLGRTLLTLVRNKLGAANDHALPPHKFSPHDIVRLRAAKAEAGVPALSQGVVYRVKETSITIAVDDMPEEGLDVPLKLEKLANEVTYDRLRAALRGLGSCGTAHGGITTAGALIETLFGGRAPRFAATPAVWTPINGGLDASQRRAVSLALSAADIALIQGPPGTGKTTTLVEYIAQEVLLRNSRVLACAASNVAVDNLVERLAAVNIQTTIGEKSKGINVVRVGHPARLLPQVLENSLEAKVLRSDDSALARDCRDEIKSINARILKLTRKDKVERTALRRDLRLLAKEERQRQERAVKSVLCGASVVCTTLTGSGARQLASLQPFDVVVIDEAAQAVEPACWLALLRGRRAVLAGDHKQLPPTVMSDEAARRGLAATLFERAHAEWGSVASVMLTTQYRMNAQIMAWSSREMYDGRLVAHSSVASHRLHDFLPLVHTTEEGGGDSTFPVLLLIDTAGCDMNEQSDEGGGDSKFNHGEAAAAMAHVQRLLKAGIRAQDIGIIAPYAAQVGLLRQMRPFGPGSAVEISTVDGFQGREKEAIVISMVRSNTEGEVGFLAECRRMNVAVTRARRQCVLVCDTECVAQDPFLKRLISYFEEHGEYASAHEYT